MRTKLTLMLVFLVLLSTATVNGAGNEYLLAPGDVLQISVWGHADLLTVVEIKPDGYIDVPPLTKDILAEGKTSSQLAAELAELMSELIVSPRVTVVIKEFRTIQVRLFGEVRNPGLYHLKPGATISELLAQAGGLTPEASLTEVRLTRDGEVQLIDFAQILQQGTRDEITLESGDTVFVPKDEKVLILGEVNAPGAYSIGETTRLIDLLALAGGHTKDANLRQIIVQGADGQRIIDFDLHQAGKGTEGIRFKGGDIIYVPKVEQAVVLGQVRSPGTFPVHDKLSLFELLAMAGNVTDDALTDEIVITRTAGDQPERIVVSLDKALEGETADCYIYGGDVVYVPRAEREVIVFGQVQRPGVHVLRPGSRLTDAIALAGGLTELADPTKISISSKETTTPLVVDATGAISAQPYADNPYLAGGDIIFVPEAKRHAIILGEVRNPGTYKVDAGISLYELLAMAGGLTMSADQRRIAITRQTEQSVFMEEVNLANALFAETTDAMMVKPGDVVYVPTDQRGILVLGEVRNPGYYRLTQTLTVLDALALAGGPTTAADLSNATLSLRDGDAVSTVAVDLNRVLEQPFSAENYPLSGGEVLLVPKADRQVVVLGEVRSPGTYEFRPDGTLLDMIALAGGPTEEANLAEVTVTRAGLSGPVLHVVDLEAFLNNDRSQDNIKVAPRDVIYVPKAQRQIAVLGEVRQPGVFNLGQGVGLLDALAMAGGLTALGDGQQVYLLGSDGSRQVFDVQRLVGGTWGQPSVEPGSVVYVPQARREITILGAVARPGTYTLQGPARLLDGLAMAGGITEEGDSTALWLTFEGSQPQQYDLAGAKADPNGPANPILVPGAVLYVERADNEVVIFGEVNHPGVYKIEPGDRLLEVLGKAGGFSAYADLAGVTVRRREQDQLVTYEIHGERLLEGNDQYNLSLMGGDVIFVPRHVRQVTVIGAVANPGRFTLDQPAMLLDVIALAGGLVPQANPGAILVSQGQELMTIDVKALEENPKDSLNILLSGGETIVVPEQVNEVLVFGEVRNPGAYPVQGETSALEVVIRAGGFTLYADTAGVLVSRVREGLSVPTETDLTLDNPVYVQGGDVIYVPRMEEKQVWVLGEVRNPGAFPITDDQGLNLLQVLALAGGLTERADQGQINVYVADESYQFDLTDKGSSRIFTGGEVVYVPAARQGVLVLGEVQRPGYFVPESGSTVLDLIALAGGLKEDTAASQARLTRFAEGGEPILVDLVALIEQGDMQYNYILSGGDVLFIPKESREVVILGEVRLPGRYTLGPGQSRLLDMISLAGGLTPEAKEDQVRIIRADGSQQNIDFRRVLEDKTLNIELAPQDLIFIPREEREVLVLGEVNRPGHFGYREGQGVLELLAQAGGPQDEADLAMAYILRKSAEGVYEKLSIDLSQGQAEKVDFVSIQPGDVLYVPRANRKVLVLGEVGQPGAYLIEEGDTLLDLLALAQGPTVDADLSQVLLSREDRTMPVDISLAMQDVTKDNPTLMGGDVIFVPKANRKVLVLGEVNRPGVYHIDEGDTLLDLIGLAQGLTGDADPSQVFLSRGEDTLQVAVNLAMQNPSKDNPQLTGGDVIFVARANRKVLILGEVNRPGAYFIDEGDTLLDLIGLAQGLTEDADPSQLLLSREDRTTQVAVDLAMQDPSQDNPRLVGGDVVFVPRANRKVLVLGEVRQPGTYVIDEGDTLLDLLGRAGGPTVDADLAQVLLSRDDQTTQVAVNEIMQEAGKDNPKLVGGDVVIVPRANRKVLVLGEVNRPGAYLVEAGDTLLDLLGLAGGPTANADLSQVLLSREDQTVQVAVQRAMEDASQENPRVTGGDVVIVPRANRQVLVLGEVNSPGYYLVEPGAKVLDVLALAKDITPQADPTSITLVRQGEKDILIYHIDLDRIRKDYDLTTNIEVRGGDVLIVPEGEHEALILGEVRNPGSFPVKAGDRLFNLITKAGGLSTEDLGEAIVVRRDADELQRMVVDLQTVLHRPESSDNLLIYPGDLVYIPLVRRQVSVLGAVTRPGQYPLYPGDTLLDVIAKAGGLREDADQGRIIVGDEAGERIFSLNEVVSGVLESPSVEPGSVVYVPVHTQQVLVFGEVRSPGAYPIGMNNRLVDIIALAGGVTDQANTQSITLTRADGSMVHVYDLLSLYRLEGDEVRVFPGDVIYIPRVRNVLVLGQVRSPGAYMLPPGSRLLDAIGLAGGVLPGASLEQITITRQEGNQDLVLQVDFHALTHQLAMDTNYPVFEGDVIFVPEAKREVVVLGQVQRPGMYAIGPETRVMDVIAMAGGPTERAALESVGIYRGADISQVGEASLGDKLLFEGDVKKTNPLVVGGDIIYVPETTSPDWSKIFEFLTGVKLFKDLVTGW